MDNVTEMLEEQAELLFQNVNGWQTNALKRIGRRVKEIQSLSYADLQSLNNATIVNQDVNAILNELAAVTEQNALDVQAIYAQMLEEQHLKNEPLYDYRNKPFVPFKDNKQLQSIVKAYARTTAKTMVNLSMTKARQIGTVDKNGHFVPINKSFHNVLDKAVMSIATGTGDFHSEMRDVLMELGGSGLRVDYGGGVTRRLDTMVRQNLLWGAKQANLEYSDMIGEELGCDGIEIDWHAHPRPSHAFMQGKQYALGKERTVGGINYKSADDVLRALEEYGCLHFKFPIILGVSVPAHSDSELKRLNAENKKMIEIDGVSKTGYEWKQTMRRLETESRKTREQKEILKSSGNNTGARQLNAKLNAIDIKYRKIAEASGIEQRRNRMGIVKGNAVKGVDKSRKSDIIKVRGGRIMNINNIDSPIEQRNTGKGNPNAILIFDRPLNNRQQKLLDSLVGFDSRVIVPKKSVKMSDLSALTAVTGDEFALFTKGAERLVVRGNANTVNIDIKQATELSKLGYKWSGHTHPGVGFNCLQASPGDVEILKCFNQKVAYIYNSQGIYLEFERK